MDWLAGQYVGTPRVLELTSKVERLRQEHETAVKKVGSAEERVSAATDAVGEAREEARQLATSSEGFEDAKRAAFAEDSRARAKVKAVTDEVDKALAAWRRRPQREPMQAGRRRHPRLAE